jgi:hypothetical protein
VEAVKTEPESVKLKNLHCLEAVARERLFKTLQVVNDLAWKSVIAL